jgi:hypothetical protein
VVVFNGQFALEEEVFSRYFRVFNNRFRDLLRNHSVCVGQSAPNNLCTDRKFNSIYF